MDSLQTQLNQAREDLRVANAELERLRERLDTGARERRDLEDKVDTLQKRVLELESTLRHSRRAIDRGELPPKLRNRGARRRRRRRLRPSGSTTSTQGGSMSLAELRDSLALWRRRHTWRQRRLDYAHLRNDAAGIAHWQELLEQAGRMIRQREHQIADAHQRAAGQDRRGRPAGEGELRPQPRRVPLPRRRGPNTTILAPTPRNYRSDCSQFAVNVYRLAGVPCPGSGTYLYSNTISIEQGGRIVARPQPGDLGMYGARGRTHHVEVYIGGGKFIGHGTARIDSLTPGQPSFYLSFLP
jgi:hypothetical protein